MYNYDPALKNKINNRTLEFIATRLIVKSNCKLLLITWYN